MNIIDIINKKRNKIELTKEEIEYSINNYLNNNIKDYQMSSLLMAICINGMNDEEIINLTDVMLNSGEILDLSKINGIIVDKHSTGGVGDKVTLVLAPILASLGIKIAKMSGRGLGHTGGTIDKLESIKGFNTSITNDEFIKQVNDINIAIVSQTGNLVPADKKIYALRDVSGTVESIPLIASSIMSKKLASNSDIIVIDVKVGNGALMKDLDSAKKLAKTMCMIGKRYNKVVICILTNMSEPLGYAIGNSLEVIESINTLKGNGPKDLLEIVMSICTIIICSIKKINVQEAQTLIFNTINNKQAYNKFLSLVKYQGGNIEKIKVSENCISIKSNKEGYINNINTYELGNIARMIGAGRLELTDKIDYQVGLVLNKKIGDHVNINEELLKVYYNEKKVEVNEIIKCFNIEPQLNKVEPLIYEIIK